MIDNDDPLQRVSVTTGAPSAGSMRSSTWTLAAVESVWSVEVTERVPTVKCARRTISSPPSKMLMTASLVCHATVIPEVSQFAVIYMDSTRCYIQLLYSIKSQAPLTSSAPLMASASVSQE